MEKIMSKKYVLLLNASANVDARALAEKLEGERFKATNMREFITSLEEEHGLGENCTYLYTLDTFSTIFNDTDEDNYGMKDFISNYFIAFVNLKLDY
jgi:hypothetical protein